MCQYFFGLAFDLSDKERVLRHLDVNGYSTVHACSKVFVVKYMALINFDIQLCIWLTDVP